MTRSRILSTFTLITLLCFSAFTPTFGSDKKPSVKPATQKAAPAAEAAQPADVATQSDPGMASGMHGEDSNRTENHLGIYIGLLGDPFPTLIGGNLAYNILDFARVSAGFGTITSGALSATTFGFGAKGFVPGWNFSPTLTVGWASVSITGTAPGLTVGGFSTSSSHIYIGGGLDWQAASGFNVGAGYNYSLQSGVGGLPYINLGWFFDWI